MLQAKKQNFIHGAMILTAATMVAKVIGMFYKIPLANILGGSGMSYFISAYSVFNPIYALSISGLPVAVSKLVSESKARGNFKDMRKIGRISLMVFVFIGLISMFILLYGAGSFARMINNPDAGPAIFAIAPALFFCCLMSSFRGYYQGISNMTPTAISQVVESLAKLFLGIFLANYFAELGVSHYYIDGTVYGVLASSLEHAQLLALPYAAMGALLGVTASTAIGAIYLILRHITIGDGITKAQIVSSARPRGAIEIAKKLIVIALPICLAATVGHVSSLVDLITIMNRIGVGMQNGSDVILAQYSGLIPANIENIASYLYGAYGFSSSLFNLIPALTIAMGISALPVIASDWATMQKTSAHNRIRSVIKLTSLIAMPAGLGLVALAKPILFLLYPLKISEVTIAAPLLQTLGIAAIFVGITTPMMSLFQAIGKTLTPVKLLLCGAFIKAITNYVLLAIPSINIKAAPIGTVACYAFILFAGLYILKTKIGIDLEIKKTLIGPFICGIICAVAANTSNNILSRFSDSKLITLISIAIGGMFYVIFILFLKIITKNEVLLLPNGKKISKMLEKFSLLG